MNVNGFHEMAQEALGHVKGIRENTSGGLARRMTIPMGTGNLPASLVVEAARPVDVGYEWQLERITLTADSAVAITALLYVGGVDRTNIVAVIPAALVPGKGFAAAADAPAGSPILRAGERVLLELNGATVGGQAYARLAVKATLLHEPAEIEGPFSEPRADELTNEYPFEQESTAVEPHPTLWFRRR